MYVTKVPVMLDSPTNGCLLIACAKQHMRYAAAYMHVYSWGCTGSSSLTLFSFPRAFTANRYGQVWLDSQKVVI